MIAVIKATILNCVRDRKNLIFMLVFPLFLILIIGNTLSSYFDKMNTNFAIEDLSICYIDEGNNNINEVFKTFVNIVKESKEINNVEIKEISNIEEGKREVQVNRAIVLYLKDNTIEMYSNDDSYIRSSTVYQILNSISNKYNTIAEVYTISPQRAGEIINSENNNFIEENNIPYEKSPNSMNYYGVAEIGLMLFYFINYPLFTLKEDKRSNIKDRIKISGLSTPKYYLASFTGYFMFSFGVSLTTYILSSILFDINYGNNLLVLPLAMIPFLIIVNGIGTIMPIIFKENKVASIIVQNIIIPVLCFLGGGYVAVYGEIDGIFDIITKMSPLRWFNSSVFRYIYSDDSSLLINWLLFGIIALILIIVLIYLISGKEDNMNEEYINVN